MCEETDTAVLSRKTHQSREAVGTLPCEPESGLCTLLIFQSIYDFPPQLVPFSLSRNTEDHVSIEEITLLLKSQFSLAPAATVLKIIERRGG